MGKLVFPEYNHRACILCFDKDYILVAIFRCADDAAKFIQCQASAIRGCISGDSRSSFGFYWRYEDITVRVSIEDIGSLTVHDFDSMCGVESDTFENHRMHGERRNRTSLIMDRDKIAADAVKAYKKTLIKKAIEVKRDIKKNGFKTKTRKNF